MAAKNWKMNETIDALEKKSFGLKDLARRFPLTTVNLLLLNDAGKTIVKAIPDVITVRKVEKILMGEELVNEENLDKDESELITEKEKERVEQKEKKRRKARKPLPSEDAIEEIVEKVVDDDDFDWDE